MAPQIQQHLHDPDVSLVDPDVQRRLPPLVPGVEVGARARQQLHDGRLVAEGRVVHGPVAVLVLQLDVRAAVQQHPDHLQVAVLAGGLQQSD